MLDTPGAAPEKSSSLVQLLLTTSVATPAASAARSSASTFGRLVVLAMHFLCFGPGAIHIKDDRLKTQAANYCAVG
jgi:hypothetical protein